MRTLRWGWRAVEVVLALLGLVGVPDAIKKWSGWLTAMDQDLARWLLIGFVIVSLVLTESKAVRSRIAGALRAVADFSVSRFDFGRKIELEIEQGLNAITFTPAFSAIHLENHDIMVLDAFLGAIRVVNNDSGSTTVDRIWLEVKGLKPRGAPSRCDLEGDRVIGARRFGRFRLTYCQVYLGVMQQTGWQKKVRLRAKVLGFGVVSIRLPEHVFTGPHFT